MSGLESQINETPSRKKRGIPAGLWVSCPGCKRAIFRKEIDRRQGICPECDYHYYVCLLYTSPSPRDRQKSRMPSSA